MDELADIPPQKFPRHIAVIMDGNGRWAVRRGLERVRGHQQGARTVREVVTECARLRKDHGGPDFLTLYSFILENWKRPADEVTFLMQMYIEYLQKERATMMENNIRFQQIGRLDNLPDPVLEEVGVTLEETREQRRPDAGAGAELRQPRRDHRRRPRDRPQGEATASSTRATSTRRRSPSHLYTAGMPDPDLLIRTAGEMRVSNYLLWQISYAELFVSDVLWPDFGVHELHDAIRSFSTRNRRFGALDDTNTLGKRPAPATGS